MAQEQKIYSPLFPLLLHINSNVILTVRLKMRNHTPRSEDQILAKGVGQVDQTEEANNCFSFPIGFALIFVFKQC
jgi:hypothetical protein